MNNKKKKLIAVPIIVALNMGVAAATVYGVAKTMLDTALDRDMPKIMKKNRHKLSATESDMEFISLLKEYGDMLEAQDHEIVQISGRDDVNLVGHWFKCKHPKRVVVAMHGWRSSWSRDFGMIAEFLHANDCDVLYAEQRGQNNSGGDTMGFGMIERFDCQSWANWIAKQYDSNMPIYLMGVSMGATTVLMTSNLELPNNVRGIMTDCGFTSPYDIWKHIATNNLHLPYGINAKLMDYLCERKIRHRSDECSTIDCLKETTIPVIFAHGENDHFVPVEMTYENYNACVSPKEILIVPEADHGMSYYMDKSEYEASMKKFWNKYDKF